MIPLRELAVVAVASLAVALWVGPPLVWINVMLAVACLVYLARMWRAP